MNKVLKLLRNRNFILCAALGLGLLWGEGATWTEGIALPALALVMTLSTTGVSGSAFRSPRTLLGPALSGLAINYGLLAGFILGLNFLLIHDEALRSGFILLAAVPPAVAVIPFTGFLKGNSTFSLIGTIGCFLGALIIMPLIALGFLGSGFVEPLQLFIIMVELIIVPLILSRILIWTGMAVRIEPVKGTITNWSFFLVSYTIVGLNRAVFLDQPLSLFPVALIAVASTFFLGWVIEKLGGLFRIDPKTLTSLVLLGTLKNYGLAGGLALALFSKRTAVPAT
ncbi:MAG: bile acid:sodium symporter family protein, partial [Planctomycetota bacterium]